MCKIVGSKFRSYQFVFKSADGSKWLRIRHEVLLKEHLFPPPTSSLLRDQGGAGQALGGVGEAEGEHDEAEQALPGHTQRAGEV